MAFIKSITVSGYRCIGEPQTLELAIPNKANGESGLTILVGPNNGGKSTLLEAIELGTRSTKTILPRTDRHDGTDYRTEIHVDWVDGTTVNLESVVDNPEVLEPTLAQQLKHKAAYLVRVPRFLPQSVIRERVARQEFLSRRPAQFQENARQQHPDFLSRRVPEWNKPGSRFKELSTEILGTQIRLLTEGNKATVKAFGHEHETYGLGRGAASILCILDSIHDAPDDATVLIDEPEQSLHPALQLKLVEVLAREANRIQIVYATHSPYFIHWDSIFRNAKVARVVRHPPDFSVIHFLSRSTTKSVKTLVSNFNNPHILGVNAREALFLDDKVILVEGQEDVQAYRKMAKQLDNELRGEFFGWGCGGAGNMQHILQILNDLGYRSVFGILDGDKLGDAKELKLQFPQYKFAVIPVENVRDRKGVKGLCSSDGKIHPEQEDAVRDLFGEVQKAFRDK